METLHTLLSNAGTEGILFAISGLGGIGKTALAIEYAYRYAEDYAYRFLVNASSPTTLTDDYRRITVILGSELPADTSAEIVVQTVKSWLDANTGYLLIVDNADFTADYTPEHLQALLPNNPKGHLLLTSRAQTLSAQLNVLPNDVMRLDTLEEGEAVALLVNRLHGEGKTLPDTEQQAAVELANALGGLPLALEQAAAYAAAKQTSLRAYLSLYRKAEIKQLEKAKPETGNYKPTIATTWKLNFDAVAEAEPAAADLLTLCAFLAPDNIPVEAVIGAAKGTLPSVQSFFSDLEDMEVLEAQYNELLEPLTRYSLIEKNPVLYSFSCHRLVQTVLRETLNAESRRQWVEKAVEVLFAVLPLISFDTWSNAARLFPQIQALLLHCQAAGYESENAAWLCNQMALFLFAMGNYTEAEQLNLKALEMRRKVLPANHPLIAQSLNNLAELYRSQGYYPQAEALYHDVLQIYAETIEGDQPILAVTDNNLALLYSYEGRFTEAEPLYQEALRIFELFPDGNTANIVQCKSNLALLYDNQGRYAEAESLYNELIPLLRQTLAPNHPDIAQNINNLAGVYLHQKRYIEAENAYREALKIWQETLPPTHSNILLCYGNIAELYREQSRFDEAEPLYDAVLKAYRATLPEKHISIALTLNNLGMLYNNQKRFVESEAASSKSLEIYRALLPADHPQIATCLNNLAFALLGQGRDAEAEAAFVEALAIVRAKLGKDDSMTQTLEANLQEFHQYLAQKAVPAPQA